MAKLSDFGGGVEQDPAPEDDVKIQLSKWLDDSGAQVYWEKRPSYGHQVFRTKSSENPDLLAIGKWRNFAIEVKIGDDGGGIHDGIVQTERYWNDYANGDQIYKLPDGQIEIDAFILATQHSPDGRLYYRKGGRNVLRSRHVTERFPHLDSPIKWLPDWEFYNTESIIRVLWRFAKNTKPENPECEGEVPGIGALLSTRLDGQRPDQLTPDQRGPFEQSPMPQPAALYRTFDGSTNVHQWREI